MSKDQKMSKEELDAYLAKADEHIKMLTGLRENKLATDQVESAARLQHAIDLQNERRAYVLRNNRLPPEGLIPHARLYVTDGVKSVTE